LGDPLWLTWCFKCSGKDAFPPIFFTLIYELSINRRYQQLLITCQGSGTTPFSNRPKSASG
jgi:hypothetical protein